MGDRISIQFVNSILPDWYNKSVVLFSHWMGKDLTTKVKIYLTIIGKYDSKVQTMPFDRREPQVIMVDFIRWLTKDEDRIDGDLHLGFNENDGDNSDNGHHIFDLAINKEVKGGKSDDEQDKDN